MKITFEENIIWDRYQYNRMDRGLVLTYVFAIFGCLDVARLENAIKKTILYFSKNMLQSYVGTRFGVNKRKVQYHSEYLHTFDRTFLLNSTFCSEQINPEKGELFFFALESPDGDGVYKLFLSFSHICFDGLSYSSFMRVLSNIYNENEEILQMASVDVADDFVQNNTIAENFWREKIKTMKLFQSLPFQVEHSNDVTSNKHLVVKSAIRGRHLKKFTNLCHVCDATCFQIMTAIFGIVLYKYCNDAVSLSYTCTTNKRKDRVGCYLNLLPLTLPIHNILSIRECIDLVRTERRNVSDFQRFPFKKIQQLAADIGKKWNPNIVVNESDGLLPSCMLNLAKCSVNLIETPDLSGPFDLSLIYNMRSDEVIYAISAPSNKMTFDMLRDFMESFERVVDFVLTSKLDTKICELTLERKLIPIMTGEDFSISTEESIVNHFIEHCFCNPNKVAVHCIDKCVTYQELKALMESIISIAIKDQDVKPIAFCLTRTELIPATILAMLYIGIPYVPIDVNLPPERIKYILQASGSIKIFVDDRSSDKIRGLAVAIKIMNLSNLYKEESNAELPPCNINHTTSAYILFTSGSTGTPKGVVVTHGNLINFLYSMNKLLGVNSNSKVLALTSISFDISVLEVVLPLFVGGSIELLTEEEICDFFILGNRIDISHARVLQATPATFRGLRGIKWYPKHKLQIICGGEKLESDLAKYLLDIGYEVYNVYGPTETTVWSSFYKLFDRNGLISLGTPIYNTKYFVVNDKLKSVPLGMEGQLVISGQCVSKGYLNDHSNKNFITHKEYKNLYCTGDVVRYLGGDNLIYLERRDSQVKINGRRIDLSEIQNVLAGYYDNIDFFVVMRIDNTSKMKNITCFYANDLHEKFDEDECKSKLKRIIPEYMIPRNFYHLKAIPINSNGKVDMKFLSESDIDYIEIERKTTHNNLQLNNNYYNRICAIIGNALNINTSDLNVSLSSLGIDSVMFTQLSLVLIEHFNITIKPHEFYQFATLEDLVLYISGNAIQNITESTPFPLMNKEEVYVVGMSALLPMDLDEYSFWEALINKRCLITSPPKTRRFYENLKGGYISDIDSFDNSFFSISALEAANMDPRQKQLLQIAWKTIEDAGISKNDLEKKKVGCYIATTGGDYYDTNDLNVYSITGKSMSVIANRISRYFDWRGPSITIDTACSGSLVALSQAYNDLVNGVCDFAFVGSANIIFDEKNSAALKVGNFLSPNFRCATFDQSADGYVRAEGICGIFMASSRALSLAEHRDTIRATLKSVAIGHGGKSNSLTAPNLTALTELYLSAYTKELMQEVSYIETHGTGTKLGDPIEITSLKNAWSFLCNDQFNQNVFLGAVKTNVGHTEASAGLTSLIKVLLSIEKKMLVSNIHFNKLNEEINLEGSPFKILSYHTPWSCNNRRVAAISSFGFGGMNSHVVLEEFVREHKVTQNEKELKYMIPISARTPLALSNYIRKLRSFLQNCDQNQLQLCDIAYTLAIGRTHFEYRCAFIANSIAQLLDQLNEDNVHYVPTKKLIYKNKEQFYDNDLNNVLKHFLNGDQISWSLLFDGAGCSRIHLPTYVFNHNFIKELS